MNERWQVPMVAHDIPLRQDPALLVRVVLPVNFTPEDAERLCGIIRSLAIEQAEDQ